MSACTWVVRVTFKDGDVQFLHGFVHRPYYTWVSLASGAFAFNRLRVAQQAAITILSTRSDVISASAEIGYPYSADAAA